MDTKLMAILVCPECKGPLCYDKAAKELICKGDRLAYPLVEGIPVMLKEAARELEPNEEVAGSSIG